MKEKKERTPDYVRIYSDIVDLKYPDRRSEFNSTLSKEKLSFLEVIALNNKLFGRKEIVDLNQKFKTYNKKAILDILDYQKKESLNNSQTARHFKMSRNTLTKWRKIYI